VRLVGRKGYRRRKSHVRAADALHRAQRLCRNNALVPCAHAGTPSAGSSVGQRGALVALGSAAAVPPESSDETARRAPSGVTAASRRPLALAAKPQIGAGVTLRGLRACSQSRGQPGPGQVSPHAGLCSLLHYSLMVSCLRGPPPARAHGQRPAAAEAGLAHTSSRTSPSPPCLQRSTYPWPFHLAAV
jgi:hypothetical protein